MAGNKKISASTVVETTMRSLNKSFIKVGVDSVQRLDLRVINSPCNIRGLILDINEFAHLNWINSQKKTCTKPVVHRSNKSHTPEEIDGDMIKEMLKTKSMSNIEFIGVSSRVISTYTMQFGVSPDDVLKNMFNNDKVVRKTYTRLKFIFVYDMPTYKLCEAINVNMLEHNKSGRSVNEFGFICVNENEAQIVKLKSIKSEAHGKMIDPSMNSRPGIYVFDKEVFADYAKYFSGRADQINRKISVEIAEHDGKDVEQEISKLGALFSDCDDSETSKILQLAKMTGGVSEIKELINEEGNSSLGKKAQMVLSSECKVTKNNNTSTKNNQNTGNTNVPMLQNRHKRRFT